MPVKKTDSQQWVDAALAVLDGARAPKEDAPGRARQVTGRYLAEVGLDEICALVAQMIGEPSLSKGGFYNHFHDRLPGFYRAVISAWRRERDNALEQSRVTVIQNLEDRLRVLRACAEQTAVRDDAMRRWAAAADAGEDGAAEAARALAASNAAVLSILTDTLAKLGLPSGDGDGADGMAETYAKLIAAEFGCGRGPMTIEPGNAAGFRHLIRGLTEMAAAERQAARKRHLDVSEVEVGGRPMNVFVIADEGVTGEHLQAAVQDLAERVAASDAAGGAAGRAPGR